MIEQRVVSRLGLRRSATLRHCGAAVGLLALALVASCGGAQQAARSQAVETTPPRHSLPEPALAIPEGALWLLVVEPQHALEAPALRRLFDILLPPRRIEAWAARYAVDPRGVERAALAGYADGRLLIAQDGLDAAKVVAATARAMDAVETEDTTPTPRAVGLIGNARYLVAVADERRLVLGEDAPESWSVIVSYADGRRAELPPPAIAQAAHRVAAGARKAPLVLHMLTPLALPLDTPIGVVLAGQKQLSATLSSADPASVDVWIALQGEFPSTIEDNLRAFITSLAQEPLGAALGIADALDSLRIERGNGAVIVQASLPTERVARGLETLFGAELWQLIENE